VVRGATQERAYISLLKDLAVPVGRGRTVPLAQIADISYGFEQGVYWRRDRLPMITVRADLKDGIQAPVVSGELNAKLDEVRARLPLGYRIDTGGAVEDAGKGQKSIAIVAPVMVLVMLTALMLQLQSFSRLALVFVTAPLGLIGATGGLLISGRPFGFVALLGLIALAGMIMRNSVILVDQIDTDIRGGSGAGDDSAHAIRVLRADGGGDHGRAHRRHGADAAVPAGAVCRVVPGTTDRSGGMTGAGDHGPIDGTCPRFAIFRVHTRMDPWNDAISSSCAPPLRRASPFPMRRRPPRSRHEATAA